MYCIGICDDDLVFTEYIKRLFFDAAGTNITFLEYPSGEDLIQNMKNCDKYDLLILDIAMPGMDGTQTAKKFREYFPDTLLVFCSGICMPTAESFETLPYRYWLKQYTEEKMRYEVEGVLEKLSKYKHVPLILGKRNNQYEKLSADRISYISIAKRGTEVYYGNTNEKYTSTKKLAELYALLKDYGFVYAHNSYIVNLKYVASAGPKELEFMNGEKLTISRARSKAFLEAFVTELSEKYKETTR